MPGGPRPRGAPARQKVHRSCTGLSLLKPLLAEASGFCVGRLESSPFKLFLHTGHVSCCERKGGGGNGCRGGPSRRTQGLGGGAGRLLPALTRARCSCCGRSGCRAAAGPARPARSPLCRPDTPAPCLRERREPFSEAWGSASLPGKLPAPGLAGPGQKPAGCWARSGGDWG